MRNIAKLAAVAGVALSLAACGGQESANTTDTNTTITDESLAPVEGTTNDTMSMDAANNMSGGMMNDTMTTNSTTSGGNMTGNMSGNMTGNMSDMSTNTMTTTTNTTTTNAM